MKQHFTTLARYNRWANRRLYDACAELSEDDYRRRRPAFFGSIHGTLNHLLVGDRLWLGRFGWSQAMITGLDQILYDDLAALRAARAAEDEGIIARIDGQDDAAFERVVRYRPVTRHLPDNGPKEVTLHWALTHFFNHQTHHRGQVHDLLCQTPVVPPPLDLIYFLLETP
jgi:uncharacterized damage-inducible protein DinB